MKRFFFLLNTLNTNQNDSIIISHIGFEIKKIVIKDFDKPIVLSPHHLSEHIVFGIQIKQLMLKVVENIDKKYFSKSFNAKGFFREIMLENNEGVLIGELTFNSLINEESSKYDKIHIINGRKSIDYRKIKSELVFGVPEILSREPTRVKKEYLSLSSLDKYDYEIIKKTNYENTEVYVVSFSSKKCSTCKNMPTRIGTMTIDSDNFSILEIEYVFNKNRDINDVKNKLLDSGKLAGANTKTSIKIKYTNKDGIYYPFFYNFRSDFLFAQDGEIIETTFLVKMLINDVTFSKLKKVKDNYKEGKGLKAQTKMELANEFFGIDAYILPSDKERKAINDVLKK